MSVEVQGGHVRPRRSIFLIAATSFALSFSALGMAPARATDPEPPADSWQAAAEDASATPTELRAEVADGSLKLVVVRDVNGAPEFESVHVTNRNQLESKLAELNNDPSVVAIDEDVIVRTDRIVQTSIAYSQWAIPAISATNMSSEGSGIVVAVVDSGVESSHRDLEGQVIAGADFVQANQPSCSLNGDTNKGMVDPNGHGTHVAGIIAAKGLSVRGVAPGAKIMPIRVIGSTGSGSSFDVACGISYAIERGAKVINLSLGSDEPSSAISAAIVQAHQNDITVVAAAGNNAQDCTKSLRNLPNYPAAEPNVIAVGAIEPDGKHAGYSTWGPQVDISAPGSTIISTYKGNTYATLSGTSMASPHVAAVAAIVLSSNPALRPDEVLNRLISTAFNLSNTYSEEFGYGIVSASAAISGTRATSQEPFSGSQPANLDTPACIQAEIEQAAADKAAADKAAAAEKAAADKLEAERAAADKMAADKAAADKIAVEQAAAAEAARVAASLPVVKKSLKVKALKKKRVSVAVAAPSGSRTFVQRKVGKKWRNVVSTTAVPSMVIKVTRAGTYRVRVVIPTGTVTSKSFRVK